MLPATNRRVANNTCPIINREIREATRHSVNQCAKNGPHAITQRLKELDQEWDIERTLEANASTIILSGLVLGATVDRRWFVLPGLVAAFLVQHAVQGWCPPLPILRRLGIRTAAEINEERYALKAIRGDFDGIAFEKNPQRRVQESLAAATQ